MYAAECHADESVESQTLDHSHAAYLALTDYLIDLAVYVGCEDALVDLKEVKRKALRKQEAKEPRS